MIANTSNTNTKTSNIKRHIESKDKDSIVGNCASCGRFTLLFDVSITIDDNTVIQSSKDVCVLCQALMNG